MDDYGGAPMMSPQQPGTIADNLEARKQASQTMEIQLRIIAVEAAVKVAKPGESPKETLARVAAISGYLYTGKA